MGNVIILGSPVHSENLQLLWKQRGTDPEVQSISLLNVGETTTADS